MPKPDFHFNIADLCRKENIIPPAIEPLFKKQAEEKKDLTSLINKTLVDKRTVRDLLHAIDYTRKFFDFCKGMLMAWNKASPEKKESFHLSEELLLSLENYANMNLDICNKLKNHVPELSAHFKANPKLISKLLDSCAESFGVSRLRLQKLHTQYLEFESKRAYT